MKILLVDDDQESRRELGNFLRGNGHEVVECSSGEEGYAALSQAQFPLVLADLTMPGMSGIDLLRNIKSLDQEIEVILLTSHGSVESAVAALRLGAYDYLLKPVKEEELAITIERIADYITLRGENKQLRENFDTEVNSVTQETKQELAALRRFVAQQLGLDKIVGVSSAMREIISLANQYHSDRSIPVLIEGETGTGKEVVARLIHYGPEASSAPFVDLNCAVLNSNLVESELFGYDPGAFTGGLNKGQKGKFDLAAGGTLFLDEIGEMPYELQSKLLRVLQEKTYFRVGGLKKIVADSRIICATNSQLDQAVSNGNFRADLFYRLKIGYVFIPPLRERPDDIIPLAESFLRQFARERRKNFQVIAPTAQDLLLNYRWPGNVRELKNTIEWASFMHDGETLEPEHLGILQKEATVPQPPVPVQIGPGMLEKPRTDGFSLSEAVDQIILKALRQHGGNVSQTARYLGVSRRVLAYKLQKMPMHGS